MTGTPRPNLIRANGLEMLCYCCESQHAQKISYNKYSCTSCGCDTGLQVTSHAREQWNKRADDANTTLLDAFYSGVRIGAHKIDYIERDEARYHKPSETVLLRDDWSIITVYYRPTAKRTIQQHALDAWMDVHGADSVADVGLHTTTGEVDETI